MKAAFLAGIAAPIVLFAGGVQAADLPRRAAPLYAAPAVPVFTWTGFYAGVNGGYGFGSFNGSGAALPGDPDGGFVGGTVGYNYQIQNFVLGLEADIDYAAISNTQTTAGPVTAKGVLNFQDTVRGRIGYAVNRVMFYATGGYAGGSLHATIYDTPKNFFAAESNYLDGYALGAGVEYAVMPNLSAKAEYLHTDLGKTDYFAGTPDASRIGISTDSVRVGVNYHF